MQSRESMIADLASKVRSAARRTAGYWPGTIDADDVEQEIWVRVLELSGDSLARLHGSPDAGVHSTLNMIGMQVASRYRDDYELFSGNYRYSGDEVRELLESGCLVFDDELTATERVDMSTAMQRLEETSPQYATALVRRYIDDVYERADKDTLSYAVRALTREMNRNHKKDTAAHSGPALRKGTK